jgi:hypothetical protein
MAYKGNQVLLGFVINRGPFQGFLDIGVRTFISTLLDCRPKEVYFSQMTMSDIERATGMIKESRSDMSFRCNRQSSCSWSKVTFCDLAAIGRLGSMR